MSTQNYCLHTLTYEAETWTCTRLMEVETKFSGSREKKSRKTTRTNKLEIIYKCFAM
jgi:hypothetical protein